MDILPGFHKKEDVAPALGQAPETQATSGSGDLSGNLDFKENVKKRGRPAGIGNKAAKSKSDDLQAGLEDLYKPEAWEEVAALPFNVRRAMTGSEVFELSKPQKSILGASLAASMKTLELIDPKYVALTVLAINMTTIFAEKEVQYRISKKRDEKTNPGA